MFEIIPAIMPKDIEDLSSKVGLVSEKAGVVQVDAMDGIFVPEQTWPFGSQNKISKNEILDEKKGMPFWRDVEFEFDLMAKDSYKHISDMIGLGASRLVFHLQSIEDREDFLKALSDVDDFIAGQTQIGLAFGISDDIYFFQQNPGFFDFVQFMGIEKIGYQGGEFDRRVIDNVSFFRSAYPDIPISVDGGVNLENARDLIAAGANRLVAGSAIFSGDAIENLESFEQIAQEF